MFVSFLIFGNSLNLVKIVLIPDYVVLRAEQKIRKSDKPQIVSPERSVLRVCQAEQTSCFWSTG